MPGPSPRLFQKIYDLGEQLCAAAEQNRIASVAALVEERDLLIKRLEAYHHPSEVDAAWTQWRTKFARQHEALSRALAAIGEQTMDARRQVEALAQAHRQYESVHDNDPSGVLHSDFAA